MAQAKAALATQGPLHPCGVLIALAIAASQYAQGATTAEITMVSNHGHVLIAKTGKGIAEHGIALVPWKIDIEIRGVDAGVI